jgi:hypothetical protein
MKRAFLLFLISAGLVGCDPAVAPNASSDAGPVPLMNDPHDAGTAGPVDAGPADAGPRDAGGPCFNPETSSDCGKCATQQACGHCFDTVDATGAADFHALMSCVLCDSCYTSCNLVSSPAVCMSAPADAGVCDIGGPSNSACTACTSCAQDGPCSDQRLTCQDNPACLDIARNSTMICGSLPM